MTESEEYCLENLYRIAVDLGLVSRPPVCLPPYGG